MDWWFGALMIFVAVLIVPVTRLRMRQRPQDFEITHPRLAAVLAIALVVMCGVLLVLDRLQ